MAARAALAALALARGEARAAHIDRRRLALRLEGLAVGLRTVPLLPAASGGAEVATFVVATTSTAHSPAHKAPAGCHLPDLTVPRKPPSVRGNRGCAAPTCSSSSDSASLQPSSRPCHSMLSSLASSSEISQRLTTLCGAKTSLLSASKRIHTMLDLVACSCETCARYRAPSMSTPKKDVGTPSQRPSSAERGPVAAPAWLA